MSGHGEKLPRQREAAVAALLVCGGAVEKAARRAGVGPATLRRWMQEPGFDALYRAERRKLLDRAVDGMLSLLDTAAATLKHNMRKSAPAAQQVQAARAVIAGAVKAFEVQELAEEIEALQRQLDGAERPPQQGGGA